MAEQTEYHSQGCMLHTDAYPRLPQPIPTSNTTPTMPEGTLWVPFSHSRCHTNNTRRYPVGIFLASFLNYNPQSPVELWTMYNPLLHVKFPNPHTPLLYQ